MERWRVGHVDGRLDGKGSVGWERAGSIGKGWGKVEGKCFGWKGLLGFGRQAMSLRLIRALTQAQPPSTMLDKEMVEGGGLGVWAG